MVKGMLPMRNYILNLIYKKEEVITHFLFFRQFITHIRQKADLLIIHQCHPVTQSANPQCNDTRSLRFRWHPHGKYHAGHWGAA